MFVPITSEVTIRTGLVLKEITTEILYEVGVRLRDVADSWHVKEIAPADKSRIELVASRQDLSQKYLAEVE